MNTINPGFVQANYRDFIEKTLALWHVPGLAVAIVKAGQVILSEGYGLRNLAQTLPVSNDTLFPIASCTKAFTTLALGMLVDEGKLDWDRPVKTYLPTFQLWDAFATERITPRDLLTHRSGLPGHDMMWYATRFNRREIFDRLRFLEPTCDLRTRFQYQNLMYIVAGLLVDEISDTPLEQFIQKRIFDPLSMDRTTFSTQEMLQSADYATPYRFRAGKITEMPFQRKAGEDNPLAGAGGIISCVSDMAKWMQFLLDGGKINGQALVSGTTWEQILTPAIILSDPPARKNYDYEFSSYGLGWVLRVHKGQFLVEHDGQTDGFYTLSSLIPRAGVGIVALSNCDSYYNPVQENEVPYIAVYSLYDQLLGLEPTDWNQKKRAEHDERLLAMQSTGLPENGDLPPAALPSHPIEAYLGDYEHPGYGRVCVCKEGEELRLVMNQKLVLPLVHCYYDIFEVLFEIADSHQKIAFSTGLDGAIHQVAIAVEPRVNAVIFTRVGFTGS